MRRASLLTARGTRSAKCCDNEQLDQAMAAWPGQRAGRWIHRLEASWRLALVAIVVLTIFAFRAHPLWSTDRGRNTWPTGCRWGSAERIGSDALSVFDRLIFKPSKMSAERQADLQEQFRAILQRQSDTYSYNLVFRASPRHRGRRVCAPNGTTCDADDSSHCRNLIRDIF